MKLTIQEIAEAVHATQIVGCSEETVVTSVEFDTRQLTTGSLFVPLKGNRDGHDFIEQALTAGASVTFSDHPIQADVPHILVADTLVALQELSKYYLSKVSPKVVGITGSNGKTTTKDMTAAVLRTTYNTYKTQGNYNNDIGLPYTILSMPETTEILVLEMGMDHKGEIDVLSQIGEPDIAAITLIGESHIEHLGSRKGIAEAKMEIVSGLNKEGTLIIPNDEPLLKELIMDVSQDVESFGIDTEATLSGYVSEESKSETRFTTNLFDGVLFSIPVLGRYNVKNALIALLIGRYFEVPVDKMAKGLATFDLTKNRTEWLKTPQGMDILSDVYNANPTAMTLVLDSFSGLETIGSKVVVLGDMLELGDLSGDMHRQVAAHLSAEKINHVFLYGREMNQLYQELSNTFDSNALHYYAPEAKELLMTDLGATLTSNDTVFLKASNGMGLNEVVDYLLNNH